jgi:hypothetical protein
VVDSVHCHHFNHRFSCRHLVLASLWSLYLNTFSFFLINIAYNIRNWRKSDQFRAGTHATQLFVVSLPDLSTSYCIRNEALQNKLVHCPPGKLIGSRVVSGRQEGLSPTHSLCRLRLFRKLRLLLSIVHITRRQRRLLYSASLRWQCLYKLPSRSKVTFNFRSNVFSFGSVIHGAITLEFTLFN